MPETPEAFLVEASWEVANKVGGIYTVLATKLQHARSHFGEHYLPVGPYLGGVNPDFQEQPIPHYLELVAKELGHAGIGLHYGSWQLPGKPPVVLLDWTGLVQQNAAIKTKFWEAFQLDSLGTDFYDVDQPLLWAVATGHFAAALAKHQELPVLLHAHEWLAGGAILAIAEMKAPVTTVFTSHATVLGRALSSENTFIYDKLSSFDPAAEARRLRVTTKHQIEALSAQQATVFTIVSSITAQEATAFLGRTPTVVENGIDSALFPTYDTLIERRGVLRQTLDDFTASYFFPSYRFDLGNTSYLLSMGRYEYHNKGYDLSLAALGRLNQQLKEQNSDKTVIALFCIPGDWLRLRANVSRQRTTHQHLNSILTSFAEDEANRLELELWNDLSRSATELSESARDTARRLIDGVRSTENPPLCPFDLRHPESDPILKGAAEAGLTNAPTDRVKVLFFPVYLDGFDGALNLPLYDIVTACDLGLFPSRYEPWGYTPMEALIHGVPAITSSLAGFGQAVEPNKGALILQQDASDFATEHTALADQIATIINEGERERVDRRIAAYQSIAAFDWSLLYPKYLAAYQQALQ